MRILHITQSLVGGPASYLEELACLQNAEFGVDNVRFLVPSGSQHHLSVELLPQVVTFRSTRRSLPDLVRFAVEVARYVEEFDPTIVHLHSSFAGAVLRPLLALRRSSTKVVYCAHGWSFAMSTSAIKRRLYAGAERLLAPMCDKIVNISDAEHHDALQFGLPADKMVTIRNGIAADVCVSTFDPGAEAPLSLVFVGRHDRQKGLDVLIQAIQRLRRTNIRLDVVGAPAVDPDPVVQRGFASERVHIHGWLPREMAWNVIARADAVVMPSRWEGFGLTALEAMRLGKPVIASKVGGLAEIVVDGVTGLHTPPGDVEALAALLDSLNRKQLQSMGGAARNRFLASFTSQRMNEELIRLYYALGSEGPFPKPVTSEVLE